MSTYWGGDLEAVRLEPEENGWEVVVETNSGTYRFTAHGAVCDGSLADQLRGMSSELITYWSEGARAAREHAVDLAKRETDEAYDRMVGDA